MKLYHGTSRLIEGDLNFDNLNSGTGVAHEGNGFYMTNSLEMAMHYSGEQGYIYEADIRQESDFKKITPPKGSFEDMPGQDDVFSALNYLIGEEAIDEVIEILSEAAPYSEGYDQTRTKVYSYLGCYESDLLEYLSDYDLDDSAQDEIRNKLESLKQSGLEIVADSDGYLDLYKSIFAVVENTAKANEIMSAIGIPGFIYQDGRTQEFGEEVKNYVVFDLNCIANLRLHLDLKQEADIKPGF